MNTTELIELLKSVEFGVVEEVERLKESIARDLKAQKDPKSILERVQKLMEYDGVGYALTEDAWESAEANFDLYINEYNEAALLHVEHDLIRIVERETEWDPYRARNIMKKEKDPEEVDFF